VQDAVEASQEFIAVELSKGRPVNPVRVLAKALTEGWIKSKLVAPEKKTKTPKRQESVEEPQLSFEDRSARLAQVKSAAAGASPD
jgi:hypothetical protein